MGDAFVRQLKELEPFAECGGRDFAHVERLGTTLDVRAGSVLCREDATADQWLVILSGAAEVTRRGRAIGTVMPGEWFGPPGPCAPRWVQTETATALGPTRVLVFGRQEYKALLLLCPRVRLVRWHPITAVDVRPPVAPVVGDVADSPPAVPAVADRP